MSKTISFVASDDLAEFLEEESERRMTTVSSTAQMLLAEKVREMEGDDSGVEADKPGSGGDSNTVGDVFDRHSDKWYHPNSNKYNFAVYEPEGTGTSTAGEARYYKTRNGAAKAIRRFYE